MRIEVYFQPDQVDESDLKGKFVCVIDVLRASTTIAVALHNGAKEIIPVASVEYGMKIASNLFDGQFLLGGERGGSKIQGFDLGNSPKEYSKEKVAGKSIVFATTNGTKAIVRGRYAEKLLVTGFVNLQTVVNFLIEANPNEVIVICSGRDSDFCGEDALCAGALIESLETAIQVPSSKNDAAKVSLFFWQHEKKNLRHAVRNSDHGQALQILGFEADIDICTDLNRLDVLPVLTDLSKIKLLTPVVATAKTD